MLLLFVTAQAQQGPTAVPGELLVQFRVGSSGTDGARALGRANARELEDVLPAAKRRDGKGDLVLVNHPANVPANAARQALASDPAVELDHPDLSGQFAVKAMDYFTDLKTRHGMKIGGYSQALYDAIGRAGAANILFVAAAGNGNRFGIGYSIDSTPLYPASYNHANLIAVAAIDSSGKLASFSNFGATSVDIGAPGVGVVRGHKWGVERGRNQERNFVECGCDSSLAGKCVTGGRLDAFRALSK